MSRYKNIERTVLNTVSGLVGMKSKEIQSRINDNIRIFSVTPEEKITLLREIWESYELEFPEDESVFAKINSVSDITKYLKKCLEEDIAKTLILTVERELNIPNPDKNTIIDLDINIDNETIMSVVYQSKAYFVKYLIDAIEIYFDIKIMYENYSHIKSVGGLIDCVISKIFNPQTKK